MTTATMQTIDRRRRTSNGTSVCACCQRTIQAGAAYIQDSSSSSGTLVQRDICMPCMDARPANDKVASFVVIAAVVILLAVSAAVFGG